MKNPITFILVIALLAPYKKAQSQGFKSANEHTRSSIDSLIEAKMSKTGIVGMSAAIIVNNKLAWIKGFGYADREKRTPFTPKTIMNIASITKTFTGVCLMQAVEDKKVSLDEDINTYLPFKVVNPNFPDEKITLRHLATHTSGLVDRHPFYGDSTQFYGGEKPEDLGSFISNYFLPEGKYYSKDNFLQSKPGTYRAYSNVGAGLAGYIVELRTGEKLSEYAKKHIFKPLKMYNSGWSLSDIDINKHTKLYSKQGDKVEPIPLYESTTYPDGGMRTSVAELSNFFSCLLNDGKYQKVSLLNEKSARELTRFQFTEQNKPENVKLNGLNSGIFWATKMGGTRIGHNGSDPGVRTFMLADLTKEVAVIFFSNTSLNENEEGLFFDIYDDLYNYGNMLKNSK
ncbi:serine hydrolase domain-containing protein [Pedobacter insulae]|uniref:CubicO group peptidase, beta-lactamase class C family n=1 Tax=Pedobacter insulae TaxID=414048 RepID=A0A1I2WN36_9SPHI|nr:serine hydrolase domain-containing protein [Pedobacter insulae]SFH02704.1 CubicO group peptidase, beta-lactamase class C family [Pedobacter insulae]